MVSSRWLEWRGFTVYSLTDGQSPTIQVLSGDTVNCHGYIMGTWTDTGTLKKQWSGLRFYVADCVFGEAGSKHTHNFLISAAMLADGNMQTCKSCPPQLTLLL